MTDYLEIDIELLSQQEPDLEIVLAMLADFGLEGFREEGIHIFAYIESSKISIEDIQVFISPIADRIKSWKVNQIEGRNWNEVWEKSYSPVIISKNCQVRAAFHEPLQGILYDLIISPKMSFGTAHHETTRLVLETMLNREWINKKVLDLGCGTGVLAILADKMGARLTVALDYDPLAYRNTIENIELNKCRNITAAEGECGSVLENDFDVILGNINLNVLLMEMENIKSHLVEKGLAILSGFFDNDLIKLDEAAREYGLFRIEERSLNRWTVAVYRKGD